MSLQAALLLLYPAIVLLFVAQAVYMRFLFKEFQQKVYMDIMDFFIERAKAAKQNAAHAAEIEQEVTQWGRRRGLRLVSNDDQH